MPGSDASEVNKAAFEEMKELWSLSADVEDDFDALMFQLPGRQGSQTNGCQRSENHSLPLAQATFANSSCHFCGDWRILVDGKLESKTVPMEIVYQTGS